MVDTISIRFNGRATLDRPGGGFRCLWSAANSNIFSAASKHALRQLLKQLFQSKLYPHLISRLERHC
jgi:hypothetical protein